MYLSCKGVAIFKKQESVGKGAFYIATSGRQQSQT